MLNLHNYFVKCDLSEEMVLIAEKIRGSKKPWLFSAAGENKQNKLRKSSCESLKWDSSLNHWKLLGENQLLTTINILVFSRPPCLLGLDPPQSMCSYRSAERLAPPPPTSGNPVLCVSDGEVSNSMELSRCSSCSIFWYQCVLVAVRGWISPPPRRSSCTLCKTTFHQPRALCRSKYWNANLIGFFTSPKVDSQASLSSTANFGENNICKKLSFSQSPVPKVNIGIWEIFASARNSRPSIGRVMEEMFPKDLWTS